MFRLLRADEIECRVQSVKPQGLVLLLYKDARCDMNILDETVGVMNWKKHYDLIDGQLFCTLEIWDDEKKQWIGKQDVGVESNTEAEKGRASDAQKRSAFAFGIGRELYSAPFIWISSQDCRIKDGRCYDRFVVSHIAYDKSRRISELEIVNTSISRVVYKMMPRPKADDFSKELASDRDRKLFMDMCKMLNVEPTDILKKAGWKSGKMTVEQHGKAMIILKEIEDGQERL